MGLLNIQKYASIYISLTQLLMFILLISVKHSFPKSDFILPGVANDYILFLVTPFDILCLSYG